MPKELSKLTAGQIEYANTRAKQIATHKKNQFKLANAPKNPQQITSKHLYEQIKSGKIKLKAYPPTYNTGTNTYVNELFDIHGRTTDYDSDSDLLEFNDKFAKYCMEVDMKLYEILDKLNLGNAKEAIALLTAFAKS